MGGEWETVELERLIEPNRGISYGIVQPGASVDKGIPIVRVSDVRNGRIATTDPLRVSPHVEAAYARTRLQGGELLLTLVGTVGEVAVVPRSLAGWNTARAVAVIPVRKDITAYWVKLALSAPIVREIIDSRLNTTVQATLNLGDVATLPIILPPEPERRVIAYIVGALDAKIELNRQMSETLEAIARALFKAWFVDFERSEDSEDRGAGTLADYVTLSAESWRKESYPEAIRYVDLSNTKFGRIESVAYHTRRDAPSRAQRVLRSGDTIVGTVRPGNGSYALISEEGLTGSTGFAVLRPRTETYREFVYLASTAAENIDRLSHLADGGAYPAVRPETVLDTRVVAASAEMIGAFSKLTRPLLARIARSERESLALTVLRDALLPKLISGELRVRDAERLLERVP